MLGFVLCALLGFARSESPLIQGDIVSLTYKAGDAISAEVPEYGKLYPSCLIYTMKGGTRRVIPMENIQRLRFK